MLIVWFGEGCDVEMQTGCCEIKLAVGLRSKRNFFATSAGTKNNDCNHQQPHPRGLCFYRLSTLKFQIHIVAIAITISLVSRSYTQGRVPAAKRFCQNSSYYEKLDLFESMSLRYSNMRFRFHCASNMRYTLHSAFLRQTRRGPRKMEANLDAGRS